ncbi:hypothetical protein ACE7GA_05900 [Roseomonas sp. CCTCC AB2023176]|uniref:hypothetical protein n=1 Tax=Roseomonas sp. CCTCC AB2023176 TaxID=3342640 RepID=UPI0035D7382E
MIFRRRNTALQLIREAASGGRDVVVARVPADATELPPEIAERLTEEEQVAFAHYAVVSADVTAARRRVEAHSLAEHASAAVEYYTTCEDGAERAVLRAGLTEALAILRRALRTEAEQTT